MKSPGPWQALPQDGTVRELREHSPVWILSTQWERHLFDVIPCNVLVKYVLFRDPVGVLRDNRCFKHARPNHLAEVEFTIPSPLTCCMSESITCTSCLILRPLFSLALEISYTLSSSLKLSIQFVRVCVLCYRLWQGYDTTGMGHEGYTTIDYPFSDKPRASYILESQYTMIHTPKAKATQTKQWKSYHFKDFRDRTRAAWSSWTPLSLIR